jgi:DNA replication protein DnaC
MREYLAECGREVVEHNEARERRDEERRARQRAEWEKQVATYATRREERLAAMTPEERATLEERERRAREAAEAEERSRREMADPQRQESARRERLREKLIESFDPEYGGCTLEGYSLYHPAQKPVLAKLQAFAAEIVEHTKAGRGLFLHGSTRCGKDHCAMALMIRAVVEHGIPAAVLKWSRAVDGGFVAVQERFARLKRAPGIVLVSDPRPITDFERRELLHLVEERRSARLATWVTVNVVSEDRGCRLLGHACCNRLLERAAEVLHFNWEPYRTRRTGE